MATTMHRLQISLPEWQAQYLRQRAELEGVSIAELIRRLVEREAETVREPGSADTLWRIAGMAEDPGELLGAVPVSEKPELYLTKRSSTRPSKARSATKPER